ncbi:hypothetical protein D3C73_1316620 [compost metagenome]
MAGNQSESEIRIRTSTVDKPLDVGKQQFAVIASLRIQQSSKLLIESFRVHMHLLCCAATLDLLNRIENAFLFHPTIADIRGIHNFKQCTHHIEKNTGSEFRR